MLLYLEAPLGDWFLFRFPPVSSECWRNHDGYYRFAVVCWLEGCAGFLLLNVCADRVLASLTVLHVIAITSTIYRIFHRFKIQRVWFDDYLAFIPLIADILFFIALWVRFPGDGPRTCCLYTVVIANINDSSSCYTTRIQVPSGELFLVCYLPVHHDCMVCTFTLLNLEKNLTICEGLQGRC